MTVNTVCNHNVATIDAEDGIVDAAVRMREEHVGDLIVVARRGTVHVPVGILTDRDIVVAVVAKRVSPDKVTVGEAMSSNLLTVRKDDALETALREMRQHGVRRAPVIGSGGELVGVITVDDIIQHLAVQFGRLADLIRQEQNAEARVRP